jgi:hypothetical protein
MVRHRSGDQKTIERLRTKHGNMLLPTATHGGRAVDVFFWRGSANPTPVQRAAAWILGLALFAQALVVAVQARRIGSLPTMLVACGGMMCGAKVFRNGFSRRREP